eukprot:gene2686-3262_t
MRATAVELHRGAYHPFPPTASERLMLAVQFIFEGCNIFRLSYVRGNQEAASAWTQSALLVLSEHTIRYLPNGRDSRNVKNIPFDEVLEWSVVDNEILRPNDSGINIFCKDGTSYYFGVLHLRGFKHTVEYYWNKFQVRNGKPVMLGSTHGRPLETVQTLSGLVPAPAPLKGSTEVVDENGAHVRPGQQRNGKGKQKGTVVQENPKVKPHWAQVVVHQGWLMKKGGIGVGPAKQWIKRYFVLYGTSQGHFLVYYSDVTECPLYSMEENHRNVVDLAKTTFIRPGSNKADIGDTPPHSFDIVTTEREWTLCAESQENELLWLRILTRAVDEDVAILPDEELVFKVKAKADPTSTLNGTDYSTLIKVSAFGVSVCAPDSAASSKDVERFFWVYTDFYKWSLISQNGKLALLLNVFADNTFSRRHEFVFRSKEAVRLATAIEYFIEKFMCVMHVRLELDPEAVEMMSQEQLNGNNNAHANAAPSGMQMSRGNAWQQDEIKVLEGSDDGVGEPEEDLLGFDDADSTPASAPPLPLANLPATTASYQSTVASDLLDPFMSTYPAPAPVTAPAPAPAAVPARGAPASYEVDLLGDSLLDIGLTDTAPPPP